MIGEGDIWMEGRLGEVILDLLKEVREETTRTGKKVASIETKIDDYNNIKQRFTEACEEIQKNRSDIKKNNEEILEILNDRKWLKKAVIVAVFSAIASILAALGGLLLQFIFRL